VLSLIDQFKVGSMGDVPTAQAAVEKMTTEFERRYYSGIVSERRAVALLESHCAGASEAA